MHVIVSWDITGSSEDWTRVNSSLLDIMAPYPWVRPLSTFYILQLSNDSIRQSIISQMQGVASREVNIKVSFIVSPIITYSNYDGWLSKELWDLIGQRV
ncbi:MULTISPECIES: hypothetical protein [unclassified Halobacteriovorax]|uniref:hypothetical protein n=1 Tax=unclassified Halobacteriovorax TaxID=2639665 RepID=UPI00399BD7C8